MLSGSEFWVMVFSVQSEGERSLFFDFGVFDDDFPFFGVRRDQVLHLIGSTALGVNSQVKQFDSHFVVAQSKLNGFVEFVQNGTGSFGGG